MNKLYKILAISFAVLTVIYASTELQYFTGKNETDSILLEWKTGLEHNLNRFEIERSASEPNNFVNIGSLNAIGNNSYYYFRDQLSLQNSANVYYYRLKLVEHNGSYVYSQTITVTHVISSVRDTWGSIKAIFR
ncbi:MAG: hypothetical protein N2510_05985 [Ignavibacteria bacterium]|nr:hypothetical protein [Ignavibacteria bacterium]